MARARRRFRWFWCVFLLAACCGLRAETVAGLPAQPEHHVEDFAGILSPETSQNIEDLLTQLNLKAHARIEVVTLKSMDADKSGAQPSIEQFATALEDKWKVGDKGTDRGLLLIVSLNPRKYRIEVGYGLEGILNDAKVGDIGRDMQPYLHTGNYDQALSLGATELAQDIAADAGVALDTTPVPRRIAMQDQPQVHISIVPALLFGLFIIIVLGALIRTGHAGLLFFLLFNMLGGGRGGGGYGGGGGGDWGGGGGDSGVGFGGGSGGGGASGDF